MYNNVSICEMSDLKDMSPMVLRTSGPAKLPEGYKLTMHISQGDAESVRVFSTRSTAGMHQTLSESRTFCSVRSFMCSSGCPFMYNVCTIGF